jgi:hypothetical protein
MLKDSYQGSDVLGRSSASVELGLGQQTYRLDGNAPTNHVRLVCYWRRSRTYRLPPNIPTINTPYLSAVREFQVFCPRQPSNSPLLLTNIFCERLSCWPKLSYDCHGRKILSCGQALPAWQEAYAKDCLTRPRRVLDLVPPASSTKLCTLRLLVQIWYVSTSAIL